MSARLTFSALRSSKPRNNRRKHPLQIVTKGRQTVIAMLDLAIRIDHGPIALAFHRNFPPDEHWRGTKPSQADRWRSFLNSLASPTAATIAADGPNAVDFGDLLAPGRAFLERFDPAFSALDAFLQFLNLPHQLQKHGLADAGHLATVAIDSCFLQLRRVRKRIRKPTGVIVNDSCSRASSPSGVSTLSMSKLPSSAAIAIFISSSAR